MQSKGLSRDFSNTIVQKHQSFGARFSLSSNSHIHTSVQFSSVAQSCLTLCNPMNCSTPGLPVHHHLREFTQTHVHRVRDAIQPSHPLSSLLLPSIPPSIRVFSNESTLHIRWPKYWSFSVNISSANEHPGLISFRMDWLDLLAVQGTLKSLLQYHSSKASILRCSAFFTAQLSHPYISSVQFSRSVMSSSLRPHESHHARPPCPSQTPGVHSDSRSSSP